MTDKPAVQPAVASTGGGRSVAFPFIPLDVAITRARQFWDHEGKNLAPVSAAASHWQYGLKSGALRQTVSALKQYGLFVEVGSGDARQFKLTDRALDILLEPIDSSKRESSIRAAAMAPKIYGELLQLWDPANLPSDATMTAYLLREKDFNRNSVADFIKDFRANIAFANLGRSDKMPQLASEVREQKPPALSVGDYVQWNSGGVDQLSPPRKIIKFSDGGDYAMVEGSLTGIPVAELEKVEPPPAGKQQALPPAMKLMDSGVKQDVFSLDEGQAVLQWPANMSKESFEDFEAWLKLLVKKVGRAAQEQGK